jgi:hypothetical protein
VSRINGRIIALCFLSLCAALAIRIGVPAHAEAQTQRQNNPSVKETLRWMQTTLEAGGGDYSVGHEERSTRLEDFSGCNVHFTHSTHQEPYLNGEPAPDKKPTRIDYFFALGDIDPTSMPFTKGPVALDGRSLITIRTRNDEKKITTKYSWLSEVNDKPDDTFVMFTVTSFDNDYVVQFARAFKHAVEACGGKPSLFADSDGRDEDSSAIDLSAGLVPKGAALPQQKACADQAKQVFDDYKKNPLVDVAGYTSHYDATGSRCYVEISNHNFYEGKEIVYNRFIKDAFEGRNYGAFVSPLTNDLKRRPQLCTIEPPGQPEIICGSAEEFDDLALKYFGTTPD